MITAIIAMIIGHFRFKALLKKCFIENASTELEVFDYNGKLYDTNKFIQLRAEVWSSSNLKQLEKQREDEIASLNKSKYPEMAAAEIKAIELAISSKRK